MDVQSLVSQMSDTLSAIHTTISTIHTNSSASDALSKLEARCDADIAALEDTFAKQTLALQNARQKRREEIVEKRRKEDEKRARQRQKEDEEMIEAEEGEDLNRKDKFEKEREHVEDNCEDEMAAVEGDALKQAAESRNRLKDLEDQRREINRLIDAQLNVPLPDIQTRKRSRSTRRMTNASGTVPPTITSKDIETLAPAPAPTPAPTPSIAVAPAPAQPRALDMTEESEVNTSKSTKPSLPAPTPAAEAARARSPSPEEAEDDATLVGGTPQRKREKRDTVWWEGDGPAPDSEVAASESTMDKPDRVPSQVFDISVLERRVVVPLVDDFETTASPATIATDEPREVLMKETLQVSEPISIEAIEIPEPQSGTHEVETPEVPEQKVAASCTRHANKTGKRVSSPGEPVELVFNAPKSQEPVFITRTPTFPSSQDNESSSSSQRTLASPSTLSPSQLDAPMTPSSAGSPVSPIPELKITTPEVTIDEATAKLVEHAGEAPIPAHPPRASALPHSNIVVDDVFPTSRPIEEDLPEAAATGTDTTTGSELSWDSDSKGSDDGEEVVEQGNQQHFGLEREVEPIRDFMVGMSSFWDNREVVQQELGSGRWMPLTQHENTKIWIPAPYIETEAIKSLLSLTTWSSSVGPITQEPGTGGWMSVTQYENVTMWTPAPYVETEAVKALMKLRSWTVQAPITQEPASGLWMPLTQHANAPIWVPSPEVKTAATPVEKYVETSAIRELITMTAWADSAVAITQEPTTGRWMRSFQHGTQPMWTPPPQASPEPYVETQAIKELMGLLTWSSLPAPIVQEPGTSQWMVASEHRNMTLWTPPAQPVEKYVETPAIRDLTAMANWSQAKTPVAQEPGTGKWMDVIDHKETTMWTPPPPRPMVAEPYVETEAIAEFMRMSTKGKQAEAVSQEPSTAMWKTMEEHSDAAMWITTPEPYVETPAVAELMAMQTWDTTTSELSQEPGTAAWKTTKEHHDLVLWKPPVPASYVETPAIAALLAMTCWEGSSPYLAQEPCTGQWMNAVDHRATTIWDPKPLPSPAVQIARETTTTEYGTITSSTLSRGPPLYFSDSECSAFSDSDSIPSRPPTPVAGMVDELAELLSGSSNDEVMSLRSASRNSVNRGQKDSLARPQENALFVEKTRYASHRKSPNLNNLTIHVPRMVVYDDATRGEVVSGDEVDDTEGQQENELEMDADSEPTSANTYIPTPADVREHLAGTSPVFNNLYVGLPDEVHEDVYVGQPSPYYHHEVLYDSGASNFATTFDYEAETESYTQPEGSELVDYSNDDGVEEGFEERYQNGPIPRILETIPEIPSSPYVSSPCVPEDHEDADEEEESYDSPTAKRLQTISLSEEFEALRIEALDYETDEDEAQDGSYSSRGRGSPLNPLNPFDDAYGTSSPEMEIDAMNSTTMEGHEGLFDTDDEESEYGDYQGEGGLEVEEHSTGEDSMITVLPIASETHTPTGKGVVAHAPANLQEPQAAVFTPGTETTTGRGVMESTTPATGPPSKNPLALASTTPATDPPLKNPLLSLASTTPQYTPPTRGIIYSRHNPNRPTTPTSRATHDSSSPEQDQQDNTPSRSSSLDSSRLVPFPELPESFIPSDTPNRFSKTRSVSSSSSIRSSSASIRSVSSSQEGESQQEHPGLIFIPRDVTNLSWRQRAESLPRSTRSASTVSTASSAATLPDEPLGSATFGYASVAFNGSSASFPAMTTGPLSATLEEPDGWETAVHRLRVRRDSQASQTTLEHHRESLNLENGPGNGKEVTIPLTPSSTVTTVPTPRAAARKGLWFDAGTTEGGGVGAGPRTPRNSVSHAKSYGSMASVMGGGVMGNGPSSAGNGGGLFMRMRSIFEAPTSNPGTAASASNPAAKENDGQGHHHPGVYNRGAGSATRGHNRSRTGSMSLIDSVRRLDLGGGFEYVTGFGRGTREEKVGLMAGEGAVVEEGDAVGVRDLK